MYKKTHLDNTVSWVKLPHAATHMDKIMRLRNTVVISLLLILQVSGRRVSEREREREESERERVRGRRVRGDRKRRGRVRVSGRE